MTLTEEWEATVPNNIQTLNIDVESDSVVVTLQDSPDPDVVVLSAKDGTERGRISTQGEVTIVDYNESIDLAFAATNDGYVYAIDLASGRIQWQKPASNIVAVTGERVILGAGADLWCYDPASGAEQWKTTLPDQRYGASKFQSGSLLVEIGENEDIGLVSIDSNTGTEEWCYRPGNICQFQLLDNNLFARFSRYSGNENTLVKIDEQTGRENWRYDSKDDLSYSYKSVKAYDDQVYIQEATNGSVVAIDTVTGQERWRSETKYDCEELWISRDDIYVNWENRDNPEYEFAKIDLQTGRTSWMIPLEEEIDSIEFGSNEIYIGEECWGDSGGKLYCLNSITGNIKWSSEIGEEINTIFPDHDPLLLRTTDKDSDNYEKSIYGVGTDGKSLWSLTDNWLPIIEATSERVVVGGDDQTFILSRTDGLTEMTFENKWYSAEGGALFVVNGNTVASYRLTTNPDAYAGAAKSGSSDTEVFEEESSTTSDTQVFNASSDEPNASDTDVSESLKYCPSCGESLDEFDEVQFCPSCGRRL